MPQAVTHILVPILIVAFLRDRYLKSRNRKEFPLHYVLAAGVGGVLPDFDFIVSLALAAFGFENWYVHKTILHSLFFPLGLLFFAGVFSVVHSKARICNLGRHKLNLGTIFLMFSLGSVIHIFLDAIFGGSAYFFFPFSLHDYGFNLVIYLPAKFRGLFIPLLDGVLLVSWFVYLELKHKISDFI